MPGCSARQMSGRHRSRPGSGSVTSPVESLTANADTTLAVSSEVTVERWSQGELTRKTDQVAEEMPVALVYHGVPHVVMLATPANLEDFAVGFTLSEGLVGKPEEIRSVEVT